MLVEETALKLITIDKDDKGHDVVICVDANGRRLIFPLDSSIEVWRLQSYMSLCPSHFMYA
jgi:hypothetical protein